MTSDDLADILKCPSARAASWWPHIAAAMDQFHIDTPAREAMFIAQIGHESGRLQFVKEIWNPAQCPWQARYEGRSDLGNIQPGDGEKFKGRGLIQITGRANYHACGQALGLSLEDDPRQLEEYKYAALSAAWFWSIHGLNELADAGDFAKITKRINGGLNGYGERLSILQRAKQVLTCST